MTAYLFNDGIGDLCQHRLSMLVYMFNIDRFNGDLCQHRFSMKAYILNDGIGDYVSIGYPCWYTCSMLTGSMVIYVSIDFL